MNAPTRYEIEARHDETGARYLIGFAGGTPSRPRLIGMMRQNGDALIERLAVGEDDEMTFGTKPRPHAQTSGWTITYTGRTQREANQAGNVAPFIASS